MMWPNQQAIQLLEGISWFSRCSTPTDLPLDSLVCAAWVSSWAEAVEAYSPTWESYKHDRFNDLISRLTINYPNQRREWSGLLKTVKAEVSQRVELPLRQAISELNIAPLFADAILSDIYLAVMEICYSQARCRIPIFFRDLLTVYRAGHFPCGWSDSTSEGGLICF